MIRASDLPDKDELLTLLLPSLSARGLVKRWAASQTPYSDIERECFAAASDRTFTQSLAVYLRDNPVVQLSLHTLLAHLSVATSVRPDEIVGPQQMLAPSGSRIARWLPTFLVINGPLGRVLIDSESPLNALLRTGHASYPVLAQARDLFRSDLFRLVRNGVGHWSFSVDVLGDRLICYDWESGAQTASLSMTEAEALHTASFAVIECLERHLFRTYE